MHVAGRCSCIDAYGTQDKQSKLEKKLFSASVYAYGNIAMEVTEFKILNQGRNVI